MSLDRLARQLLLLVLLMIQPAGDGLAQPSEGTLETPDGARLHYRIGGSGGPTLVVPLGAILGQALEPLTEGRKVVFYDMRGRGRSEPITNPSLLGLEMEIQDLEAVRQHLELERVDLLGFSYLGAVSALYAARHPSRVRRLVLAGPLPPRGPHPDGLPPEEATALRNQEAVEELARLRSLSPDEVDPVRRCRIWWRSMLPLYVSPATDKLALMEGLDLGCDLPNERPEAFLATLQGVLGDLSEWDWRDAAAGIRAPALVLHGADDRTAPPTGGREWAQAIPDARFLSVQEAGHLLWAERSGIFLEVVDAFLDGRPLPGGFTPEAPPGATDPGFPR